jgi:antitoxin HicB
VYFYYVTQVPDSGGFVVTFPDIPEAMTQTDSYDEAMEMAKDVLEPSLESISRKKSHSPRPQLQKAASLMLRLT